MFRDLCSSALVAAGLLAMGAPAAAASFDCARASAPIEHAICADAGLSAADEGLALLYRHLLSASCRGTPGIEGLADGQRAWVAAVRQDFRSGEEGGKALAAAYAARQLQLDPLVDACGAQRKTLRPLKIDPLQANGSTLPFVEGPSPEIGWRINRAVFDRMVDVPAPARRDAAVAALQAATAQRPGEVVRSSGLEFRIRLNDGRLLLIELEGDGCGAYCEHYTEQMMFDARTGQPVPLADLLTREGAKALAQRTAAHQQREGRARLAQARRDRQLDKENDEEATYTRCLREWAEWARRDPPLYPLWLDERGGWMVRVGRCSAHVNRPHDLLDDLHLPVTLADLRPLMSAYGRSLLLGQGDVRSPVEGVGRCEGPTLALPVSRPGPRFATDGEQASWLTAEGQPLTWRPGFAPQAETVEATAWRPGERYAALARGLFFSAGLREDGSLWTWGNSYQGRLGVAGLRDAETPQLLLDNVVQVSVDVNVGLALRRDGTLWIWGEAASTAPLAGGAAPDPAPRRVLDDVTQAVWGHRGEVLALRRDGSVWSLGGPTKTRVGQPPVPPLKIGEGFTRLAGHHVEAAWRADGTLWAWHETLAALSGASEPELPPSPVGRDVVQVIPPDINQPTLLLKNDGSVWTQLGWGGRQALRRIACGVRTLATASGPSVLALTGDGRLLAWAPNREGARPSALSEVLARPPVEIGSGYTALVGSDLLWGNGSAMALALRGDGELWASRPEPRGGEPRPPVKMLMQRVLVTK